jgi:hypothetical protein
LRFQLPLDIVLVIAGIAIYMHAAHVETAFFLIIGAKCVRRAVCEIVARTRFRSVLEPPPPLPTRAWSKY